MSYARENQHRIGTADLRQVEHLRKLSERNRFRRIAEEKKLTNKDVLLKRREQGFNTYHRGANQRVEEEEGVQV